VLLDDAGAHDVHAPASEPAGEAVNPVQIGGHVLEVAGELSRMIGTDPSHLPAEPTGKRVGVSEGESLQALEAAGVGAADLPHPLGHVEVIDLVVGVGEPIREGLAVLVQTVVHA
jgi:hypothetical protein